MATGRHSRQEPGGQDRSSLRSLPQIDADETVVSGTRSSARTRQSSTTAGPARKPTARADARAVRMESRVPQVESRFERSRGGASGAGTPRKRRRANTLSNIFLAVGIALLAAAGFLWVRGQWNYHKQDEVNEELSAYAVISDDGVTPPEVDWPQLIELNDEAVGWIQIPGTVINYPVYQAADNDYYLNTTVDGVYGVGGQIFMDYVNQAPGMLDAQTIIYGHHLKNGAMFKQIADMESQGFFDSIHTIWYVTRDATYKLQPLFLYYTNPDDTNVRVFNFESDEELRAYLLDILHNKGVTMNPDAETIIGSTTRVLTLSTCNYIEGQGRSILVCVEQSTVEAALGTTETTS